MSVSSHQSSGTGKSSVSSHALSFRVMRLCRPSLASHLPLRFAKEDIWVGEDEPCAAASGGGGPKVGLAGTNLQLETANHSFAIRSNASANDGVSLATAGKGSREDVDRSSAGPLDINLPVMVTEPQPDGSNSRHHSTALPTPHPHQPQQPLLHQPRSHLHLQAATASAGAGGGASTNAGASASGDAAAVPVPVADGGPVEELFASRVEQKDAMDSLGLTGMLLLPQSFGSIHLGEAFCSYISVGNHSDRHVSNVVIKAELQTERQRIVLADSSAAPIERMQAGGRHDFIIEHDIKEIGAHTLMCSASYVEFGEAKSLPQFFKFSAANPLSVKTKVRVVKDCTFLEACIENNSKTALYLDRVNFEASPAWQASKVEGEGERESDGGWLEEEEEEEEDERVGLRGLSESHVDESEEGKAVCEAVRSLISSPPPPLIRAGGGTRHFLYRLARSLPSPPPPPPPASSSSSSSLIADPSARSSSSKERSGAAGGGGASATVSSSGSSHVLGRLEILWRSTLGEPGRLQTQQIVGNPSPRKEVEVQLVKVPNKIVVEHPFPLHCRVCNHSERVVGPLRVVVAHDESTSSSGVRPIVVEGPWSVPVPPILPNESFKFTLSMLPLLSGVHKISGVGVVDARDSKPYDALAPTEIFVENSMGVEEQVKCGGNVLAVAN